MNDREAEYLDVIRKTTIDHWTYLKTRRILHDILYTLRVLDIKSAYTPIFTKDIARITETVWGRDELR